MARSISTGSPGLTAIAKDQTMDMNGPLVPEKVLKSIQVCDVIFKRFMSIIVFPIVAGEQTLGLNANLVFVKIIMEFK